MKRFNILYLAVFFMMSSCEKDANIDVPSQPKKLVVFSFISPQDEEVQVTVSLSVPLFEVDPGRGQTTYVTDAAVTISDGTTTKLLTYDPSFSRYVISASQFPIVAGKTYTLKVSTPDGKYAESSCVVPVSGGQSLLLVSRDSIPEPFGAGFIGRYKVGFTDQAGISNFYRLVVEEVTTDFDYIVTNGENPRFDIGDGSVMLDDGNQSGKQITNRFLSDPSGLNRPIDSLRMTMLITDEPYFRFHASYANNSMSDDNPFAEPVLIYSNVKGGLGCFGSFLRVQTRVKL